MFAYSLSSTGPDIDRGIAGLKTVIIETPTPAAGEVLVRQRAASLNYVELLFLSGDYQPPRLPIIPGMDGAGEIVEVGEGVVGYRPGDRVILHVLPNWRAGPTPSPADRLSRGFNLPGSLAEFASVPAHSVVRIPDHLTFEAAATLPTAGLPAWNAIRGANVGPDSTVLVLSTGGVSLFALQFAVACNARVIVTSSSEDKLRRARELGAAETINYKTNPAWDEQVLTLTEGRGVDLVIETSGAVTFEQSVRVTRVEGTIAVLGWRGGARVTLPINHVQQFKLYIVGGMVGSVADLIAMTRAIAWRKITPVIAAVYPFDEIQSAYQYLAAGDVFGKIVVRI